MLDLVLSALSGRWVLKNVGYGEKKITTLSGIAGASHSWLLSNLLVRKCIQGNVLCIRDVSCIHAATFCYKRNSGLKTKCHVWEFLCLLIAFISKDGLIYF